MKDLLNYYYFLNVDRINNQNRTYYFTYQNNYFAFFKFDNLELIDSLLSLNNYMIYNNYKISKIILNRNNQALTFYENHHYCLILITNPNKSFIDIFEIINFNKKLLWFKDSILNRSNWYFLWTRKIDNIEYTIKHLMHKYKLLYQSIYYYIGLSENAISYLKIINVSNDNLSISHQRVKFNDTKIDFYNPLNLIIDYRVRDLAEYIKSCFFDKKMSVLDIINKLKKIKMTNVDYIYLYIRLLFPTYYFDLYDLIISEEIKEENILEITKYQEDYEYLLYEVYSLIKTRVNIIGIEWINKKFAI